jgi:hypothetical protein
MALATTEKARSIFRPTIRYGQRMLWPHGNRAANGVSLVVGVMIFSIIDRIIDQLTDTVGSYFSFGNSGKPIPR